MELLVAALASTVALSDSDYNTVSDALHVFDSAIVNASLPGCQSGACPSYSQYLCSRPISGFTTKAQHHYSLAESTLSIAYPYHCQCWKVPILSVGTAVGFSTPLLLVFAPPVSPPSCAFPCPPVPLSRRWPRGIVELGGAPEPDRVRGVQDHVGLGGRQAPLHQG